MKVPAACLTAIFALGFATAVWAQGSDDSATNSTTNSNSPTASSTNGSNAKDQPGMMSSARQPNSADCQRLLQQASKMPVPGDSKKAAAAQTQITLANQARQQGHEKTCISHANLAMKYLKAG